MPLCLLCSSRTLDTYYHDYKTNGKSARLTILDTSGNDLLANIIEKKWFITDVTSPYAWHSAQTLAMNFYLNTPSGTVLNRAVADEIRRVHFPVQLHL
jgi:hypothetical protein